MVYHKFLFLILIFAVLLFSMVPASGQRAPIRVKGSVKVENTNVPVPGASVLIVNTMFGVAADSLGNFSISISPDDTLLIRAVGFKPQLYTATSRTASELKPVIFLEEDVTVLKEVQVSGRPSDAKIRTALNNMKKKEPNVSANPSPKPVIPEAMQTRPVEPTLQNPISFFSRKEREKRALQDILNRVEAQEKLQQKQREREQYNRLFKDTKGF